MKEHGIPAVEPANTAPSSKDELDNWLKSIDNDLIEYSTVLRDEGFDSISALKTLEEEDLDEMKITKKGHRRIILAAVQALKAPKASS